MMSFARKVRNYFRYRILPPHNMYTHKAERYYYEQYAKTILPLFKEGKSMLDIGCQFGRFTIPAIEKGVHVTATDIHQRYFKYISQKIPADSPINFRLESIDNTYHALQDKKFDIVLCLELLYNLKNPTYHLRSLAQLVKPGGYILTSHRTLGYYLYRYIREQNFEAAHDILKGAHPDYNAQSVKELQEMFIAAGIEIQTISPIGIFSGFGNDPFSRIANPSKLNSDLQKQLFNLENNKQLTDLYENCARYILIKGTVS